MLACNLRSFVRLDFKKKIKCTHPKPTNHHPTKSNPQVGKVMGGSSLSLSPEDFFRLHRLATSGSEIGRVRQVGPFWYGGGGGVGWGNDDSREGGRVVLFLKGVGGRAMVVG